MWVKIGWWWKNTWRHIMHLGTLDRLGLRWMVHIWDSYLLLASEWSETKMSIIWEKRIWEPHIFWGCRVPTFQLLYILLNEYNTELTKKNCTKSHTSKLRYSLHNMRIQPFLLNVKWWHFCFSHIHLKLSRHNLPIRASLQAEALLEESEIRQTIEKELNFFRELS